MTNIFCLQPSGIVKQWRPIDTPLRLGDFLAIFSVAFGWLQSPFSTFKVRIVFSSCSQLPLDKFLVLLLGGYRALSPLPEYVEHSKVATGSHLVCWMELYLKNCYSIACFHAFRVRLHLNLR